MQIAPLQSARRPFAHRRGPIPPPPKAPHIPRRPLPAAPGRIGMRILARRARRKRPAASSHNFGYLSAVDLARPLLPAEASTRAPPTPPTPHSDLIDLSAAQYAAHSTAIDAMIMGTS